VARSVIADLSPGDQIVIRALPSSKYAASAGLEQQLRAALDRARLLDGTLR
jgi:ribonuclease P protein component